MQRNWKYHQKRAALCTGWYDNTSYVKETQAPRMLSCRDRASFMSTVMDQQVCQVMICPKWCSCCCLRCSGNVLKEEEVTFLPGFESKKINQMHDPSKSLLPWPTQGKGQASQHQKEKVRCNGLIDTCRIPLPSGICPHPSCELHVRKLQAAQEQNLSASMTIQWNEDKKVRGRKSGSGHPTRKKSTRSPETIKTKLQNYTCWPSKTLPLQNEIVKEPLPRKKPQKTTLPSKHNKLKWKLLCAKLRAKTHLQKQGGLWLWEIPRL